MGVVGSVCVGGSCVSLHILNCTNVSNTGGQANLNRKVPTKLSHWPHSVLEPSTVENKVWKKTAALTDKSFY